MACTPIVSNENAARLYRILMDAVFVTGQAKMLNVIEHDGLKDRIGVELHAVVAMDSENVQGTDGFIVRLPSVVDKEFVNSVVQYRVHSASSTYLLQTVEKVLGETRVALNR